MKAMSQTEMRSMLVKELKQYRSDLRNDAKSGRYSAQEVRWMMREIERVTFHLEYHRGCFS